MTSHFFNWVSHHARLNIHHEAWCYKKRKKKMKIVEESCLERTQGKNVSVNSSLKAIRIRGQWKAFCRQRIPGPRRTSKEIVDIDILITSRNGDRKIMQPIRIPNGPAMRRRKCNQFVQFK